MELGVRVDKNTADLLQKIANLKGCSVSAAAFFVLERYVEQAKKELEYAYK